ncbi:porin [Pseudoalteromonas xiamenensis]
MKLITHACTTALLLVATPLFAAAPSLTSYGIVALAGEDVQYTDESLSDDCSAFRSKASRIGVKGEEAFSDSEHAFYLLEYGVNLKTQKKDDSFFLREAVVGLKNQYGSLKLGFSNTPFKLSQGRVDAFNDVVDLRTFLPGEYVENMVVIESAPLHGVSAAVAYVLVDKDGDARERRGTSSSIKYQLDNLYVALAYEQNITQQDLLRLSATYQYEQWQIGVLTEQSVATENTLDKQSGQLVSVLYHLDKLTFKAQWINARFTTGIKSFYGIKGDNNASVTLGVDYHLSQHSTLMFYGAHGEAKSNQHDKQEADVIGLGMRVTF